MLQYESPDRRDDSIPLQQFVSRLLTGFQPLATRKNSLIVNDVMEELKVNTDPSLLANVISRLLTTVIGKCQDSCIRLSAKSFHNVVLFRINHSIIKEFGMRELKEVEAYAASLGGCITLNTQARKGNAIILSFISHPIAA